MLVVGNQQKSSARSKVAVDRAARQKEKRQKRKLEATLKLEITRQQSQLQGQLRKVEKVVSQVENHFGQPDRRLGQTLTSSRGLRGTASLPASLALTVALPSLFNVRLASRDSTLPTAMAEPFFIKTFDHSSIPDDTTTVMKPTLAAGSIMAAVSGDPLCALMTYEINKEVTAGVAGKFIYTYYCTNSANFVDIQATATTSLDNHYKILRVAVNDTGFINFAYATPGAGAVSSDSPVGPLIFAKTLGVQATEIKFIWMDAGTQLTIIQLLPGGGVPLSSNITVEVYAYNGLGIDHIGDMFLIGASTTDTFNANNSRWYAFEYHVGAGPSAQEINLTCEWGSVTSNVWSLVAHRPMPNILSQVGATGFRTLGASIMMTPTSALIYTGGEMVGLQRSSSAFNSEEPFLAKGSSQRAVDSLLNYPGAMRFGADKAAEGMYGFRKPRDRTVWDYQRSFRYPSNYDQAGLTPPVAFCSPMHPVGGWTYIAFSPPPGPSALSYPAANAYLTANFSVQMETTDPFRGHTSNNAHILHVAESEAALDAVREVCQFSTNSSHITQVVDDIGGFFKVIPKSIHSMAKWAGDIGEELAPFLQLAAAAKA